MSAVHEGRSYATKPTAPFDLDVHRENRSQVERETAARELMRATALQRLTTWLPDDAAKTIATILGLTGHDATPDGLGSRVREANYARRTRKAGPA